MDNNKLKIATAGSVSAALWHNSEITWPQLLARLQKPTRTRETQEQYFSMDKDSQDAIKDVGGFVGGQLRGGSRRKDAVECRSLLTLDIDNGKPGLWEEIKLTAAGACAIYTTHKHRPEAPRFRLLIPLSREVSPEEYEAVSRKIAEEIGINYFDGTTHEPNRLMFWPSASYDAEYITDAVEGAPLDPDEVLSRYTDWHNVEEWPRGSEEKKRERRAAKQQDPTEKTGIVGAFCRVYDIPAAIEKYLSDVYTEAGEGRYTYVKGSTSAGLRLYDGDKFAFSHHSTDPASGILCNAFDLVRVHLFGKDDDAAKDGTPKRSLPSFSAMAALALEDPDVNKLFTEETAGAYDDGYQEAEEPQPEAAGGTDPPEIVNKLQFHRIAKDGRPLDIIDAAIAEYVTQHNRIIVIEGEAYIYRSGVYRYDKGGAILKALIKGCMLSAIITVHRIDRVYKLILSDLALQHGSDDLNRHPKSWINCRNGMLDLKTLQIRPHSPEYYSLNQIPFAYDPERQEPQESITREYLETFIPDDENREMFLEYSGYCMSAYTGFQKYLMLSGKGGIGKSVLLRMINRIVGPENLTSISLQNLAGRFNTRFLYGRLLNSCADLSSAAMTDTGILKMIVGEDLVPAEIKGGAVFAFRPYCKLLFSANSIPVSKDEQSNALYRRIMILHLEKCAKHFPGLEERLEEDAESFFYMAAEAASRAFKRGEILESRESKAEVIDLYFRSDSVMSFMYYHTLQDKTARTRTSEAYNSYFEYCDDNGRPPKSHAGFRANLKEKGYSIVTIHGVEYFKGFKIAPEDYEPEPFNWDIIK